MESKKKYIGEFPEVFHFRASTETAQAIREDAEVAGMSVGRFLRERMSGRHISAKYDLMLLNEVRRQGGLLKHLAVHGVDTSDALNAVIATMRKIQNQIQG